MTPVYFPFTDIPEAVSCVLLSCFEKIAVYHPARHLVPESLRALSAQHRLDLRLPDVQDPDPLPALLKEYHSWAELHQGEAPDFYKFGSSPPPFSDEASTAWIRSKIRKMEAVSPDQKEADRLLKARLFLAVSQEYDQQEASLSQDLHRINSQEKALFQELSPDLETVLPEDPVLSPDHPDTSRPMPEERLAAWGQLYSHCTRHNATVETSALPLFVTSDGEVLSRLLAGTNASPLVCTVSAIPCDEGYTPAWNPGVTEQIEAALNNSTFDEDNAIPRVIHYAEAGNCHENTASVSFFRINQNLLATFLPGTDAASDTRNATHTICNSHFFFIGYVTPS